MEPSLHTLDSNCNCDTLEIYHSHKKKVLEYIDSSCGSADVSTQNTDAVPCQVICNEKSNSSLTHSNEVASSSAFSSDCGIGGCGIQFYVNSEKQTESNVLDIELPKPAEESSVGIVDSQNNVSNTNEYEEESNRNNYLNSNSISKLSLSGKNKRYLVRKLVFRFYIL